MKLIAVLNRMENTKEMDINYLNAVSDNGAIPILINENNLELIKFCGGILLTGGDEKGALDDYLIKYALDNNLPLLGICQGMQSMALYNTNNKLVNVSNHYKREHIIKIEDSKLKNIIGKSKIIVNSYHHQQVLSSKEFKVTARSYDGVIEALESSNDVFQIGVEWHPERMNNEDSKKIFREFIRQIKDII